MASVRENSCCICGQLRKSRFVHSIESVKAYKQLYVKKLSSFTGYDLRDIAKRTGLALFVCVACATKLNIALTFHAQCRERLSQLSADGEKKRSRTVAPSRPTGDGSNPGSTPMAKRARPSVAEQIQKSVTKGRPRPQPTPSPSNKLTEIHNQVVTFSSTPNAQL